MDDVERGRAAGAETSDIEAVAAPDREQRMTAGRKRDAVMRVLRALEPLASPFETAVGHGEAAPLHAFHSFPPDRFGRG